MFGRLARDWIGLEILLKPSSTGSLFISTMNWRNCPAFFLFLLQFFQALQGRFYPCLTRVDHLLSVLHLNFFLQWIPVAIQKTPCDIASASSSPCDFFFSCSQHQHLLHKFFFPTRCASALAIHLSLTTSLSSIQGMN